MDKKFNKVTDVLIKELRKIVGEKAVIYEDKEALEDYAIDELVGDCYFHMPEVVLKPKNKKEISKIVKLANKENISITPRGAGSGLSGGAIPLYGGIVISLEKMNKILEIDTKSLVAVVEPGVITNDLCTAVSMEKLYYPGYPMSVETSFIGGNVATNAGGSKVIKYGNTGNHILGIEAVLPSGEIIQFGGKRRKDSSGYNFVKFLVGSEGTLAIFTKIFVNLIPLPGKTVDLLIPFEKLESVITSISLMITESGVLPTAIEYINKDSIELGVKYNNINLPFQKRAEAFLIVQFEGKNKEELENIYEKAGSIAMKNGALDVFVADNRTASENIWKIRKTNLEAIQAVDPYVPTGDIVVPTSAIGEMMEEIQNISTEYKVKIPIVGHAGDGNFHPAPMKPKDMEIEEGRKLVEAILDRIALKAVELGGAVSGEHGIGFIKKKILSETKKKEIKLMKQIKDLWDPKNIMNPGKIF